MAQHLTMGALLVVTVWPVRTHFLRSLNISEVCVTRQIPVFTLLAGPVIPSRWVQAAARKVHAGCASDYKGWYIGAHAWLVIFALVYNSFRIVVLKLLCSVRLRYSPH